MIAKITPHRLIGNVMSIGSKSYAHRALICAGLLSSTPVEIVGITPSADVDATVGCLRALGVEIAENEVYRIIPTDKLPNSAILDCIESGSTLRFFLPIVCALNVSATFIGAKRLLERPNEKLINLLESKGVKIDNYKTSGRIACGEYTIDASVSSQYVTGLLFALSMLDGNSVLKLTGEPVSKQYIDITLEVLRGFGISIEELKDGYLIHGGRYNCDITRYKVEGDWSNSAYALVGGAIGGDASVFGLNPHSRQGDMRIVRILQECGANVNIERDCVRVSRGKLHAFCVDAEQIPDMVPALCVLASYAKGETLISGIERLKIKESNRLDGVMDMMSRAGIENYYEKNVLHIIGGKPHGAVYQANNDHRMAMSQTIMAMYATSESIIEGAECVAKSYPKFFEDIKKLGGDDCVLLEGE